MAETGPRVLTVGHSNHLFERFLHLIQEHRVEVIVDTRSQPYSKYSPHFDQSLLRDALTAAGIKYVYMGRELGGRPEGDEFYDSEGHVLYGRVAESPLFLEGLTRLEKGLALHRVALMCSEENPAGCHRRMLIGRVLDRRGTTVDHIRGDGRLQSEAELIKEESGDNVQLSLFDHAAPDPWKYSIGFTQKTAEQFFTKLKGAGIRRLLDVRLNKV
jgi:uncharacterized protein (DUF488 family)